MPSLEKEISRRRTFAIISHPDAGKTTVTEQLLYLNGEIQMAGTVKARKSARHATSDWMEMEKQRGISITSSVMQFIHKDKVINLLDTPGHADFSEDTYRTLTAVDSVLMVIDVAKGVEERTIKLMEICRLRNTPIITFINKLDREGKMPIDLLDEIEQQLGIHCSPVTWPIGMGNRLRGLCHLIDDKILPYDKTDRSRSAIDINSFKNTRSGENPVDDLEGFFEELKLIKGVYPKFDLNSYLAGTHTPVFFGTALHNFGVMEFLEYLVRYAPAPLPRNAEQRKVKPEEKQFSGFVFKIQANMDPGHRDRIAFIRICSGQYTKGMKLHHVRLGRNIQINNALTFFAGEREHAEEASVGDILGLHNHGTIRVGDTFTQGEHLSFTGIPNFAPELFQRVQIMEPLKVKALLKGLTQLGEEGAVQLFRPLHSNELILGAVGVLQFDVVAWRLKEEYGVECSYDTVPVTTVRWIQCDDKKYLEQFKNKLSDNLALDNAEHLSYLAPSMINLNLTMERWPDITFHSIREH